MLLHYFVGTTDYDDVLDCEYYTVITNQWTSVAPMLTGQSDVGVAVFNGNIYVTGTSILLFSSHFY